LKRRGNLASDHPESVTATFALTFDKVQRINATATEILYTCAFLYPENIPEDILTRGVPELGAKLQTLADKSHEFDEAIATLNTYSLLRRDVENRMLSIHRLIQAVVQDTMNETEQRQWAERVVRAVNHTFPKGDYTTWTRCQQYLPHALASEVLIRQWNIHIPEAADLLNKIGLYLQMRAQYSEAEPLLKRALVMREQILGPEHPDTAASLNNLAGLYMNQGKYAEAEPLLKGALAIRDRMLGSEHFILTNSLHDLATLYMRQGKYAEAEPFVKHALTIDEKANEFNQQNVISDLNNLAGLYVQQLRYEEAEPLLKRALAIEEQIFGPQPPDPSTRKNYESLQKLIRQRDKAK
jgi:tetratricopeptide (TPR) repeat protein